MTSLAGGHACRTPVLVEARGGLTAPGVRARGRRLPVEVGEAITAPAVVVIAARRRQSRSATV
jgi:hypothetical protein